MLPLTLSYDHRIIDGADAARFMVDFVAALEGLSEKAIKP
jgi:pyruvate/2-oxoglutarate dehydrogenase complex dihydrolipoamide acyltransferase (E2) component